MTENQGDGHDKGENPWAKDKADNVVPLKVPRTTRSRFFKDEDVTSNMSKSQSEPLFNLPPVTQYALMVLIGIHIVVALILTPEIRGWIIMNLGFIPANFSGGNPFQALALVTPLSHMFLHGSWLHIAMNGVMLLAFGSGIERWIGGQRMMMVFFFSGLCGVVLHFGLNYDSPYPVIGASGGLSGLFAAALIMMNKSGAQTGRYGIWPFVLLWIGISVALGGLGSPDGSEVAWAAHIGGFLGGFAALKLMRLF